MRPQGLQPDGLHRLGWPPLHCPHTGAGMEAVKPHVACGSELRSPPLRPAGSGQHLLGWVPPCGSFSARCQSTKDLNAPPPRAGPVSGAVGQGLPCQSGWGVAGSNSPEKSPTLLQTRQGMHLTALCSTQHRPAVSSSGLTAPTAHPGSRREDSRSKQSCPHLLG